MARIFPRTGDQFATITLKVSATTAMRNKRTRVKVPFNDLELDNRPGQAARPFMIVGYSWGADTPPSKARVVAVNSYRSGSSSDPRATVAAGVVVTIDCDSDAPALSSVPLVLTVIGPATETDLGSLVLPTVTPTVGSPWTLADNEDNSVGAEITAVDLVAGVANLDDLGDVVLTSPSTGQVLKFDGTNWINAAIASGNFTEVPNEAGLPTEGTSGVLYKAVDTGDFYTWNTVDEVSSWQKACQGILNTDNLWSAFNRFSRAPLLTVGDPGGLSANVDDWSAGFEGVVRVQSSGSVQITGLAGGLDGEVRWFVNTGSQGIEFISDNGTSSTLANRFLFPDGQTVVMNAGHAAGFFYDSVAERWRLLAKTWIPPVLLQGTMTGDISGDSDYTLTNLRNPSGDQDADTLGARNAAIALAIASALAGLNFKNAVRVASPSNIAGTYDNGSSGEGATLTVTATGALSIDGVALNVGDRVALPVQTDNKQNGIWVVTEVGSVGVHPVLTRATDFDKPEEMGAGSQFSVDAGDTYHGTWFFLGTAVTAVGTDPVVLTQATATGGGSGLPSGGGTGDVLVKNSTTDGDASFTDSLGVKKVATTTGDSSDDARNFLAQVSDETPYAPQLLGRKSRGSVGSPAAVNSGDRLLNIRAQGHNGSGWFQQAGLLFSAAEAWGTARGAVIDFFATPTGSNVMRAVARLTGKGQLGLGTTAPHASAALDVVSTTGGVRIPNLTEAQRDAISSPAHSLQIFNTTANRYEWYNSAVPGWVPLDTQGEGGGGGGGTATVAVQDLPFVNVSGLSRLALRADGETDISAEFRLDDFADNAAILSGIEDRLNGLAGYGTNVVAATGTLAATDGLWNGMLRLTWTDPVSVPTVLLICGEERVLENKDAIIASEYNGATLDDSMSIADVQAAIRADGSGAGDAGVNVDGEVVASGNWLAGATSSGWYGTGPGTDPWYGTTGHEVTKAFDGNNATYYSSGIPGARLASVLTGAKRLRSITILPTSDTTKAPSNILLKGTGPDTGRVDLYESHGHTWTASTPQTFTLTAFRGELMSLVEYFFGSLTDYPNGSSGGVSVDVAEIAAQSAAYLRATLRYAPDADIADPTVSGTLTTVTTTVPGGTVLSSATTVTGGGVAGIDPGSILDRILCIDGEVLVIGDTVAWA